MAIVTSFGFPLIFSIDRTFCDRMKYWLYLEKPTGQWGVVPIVFDGHSICAIGQSLYSLCEPGTPAFCVPHNGVSEEHEK